MKPLILISLPVQSHTSVPIPNILEWSDNASNDIGSEYIIMEHARGIQLHCRWPTMDAVQQIRCIGSIVRNIRKTTALTFSAYGSLYFTDSFIGLDSKIPVDRRFCVGPYCTTRYWDCNVDDARYYVSIKPNRGPCKIDLVRESHMVCAG